MGIESMEEGQHDVGRDKLGVSVKEEGYTLADWIPRVGPTRLLHR